MRVSRISKSKARDLVCASCAASGQEERGVGHVSHARCQRNASS